MSCSSWVFPPAAATRAMSNFKGGAHRTLLDSFCDAFRGVWDCIKAERNMRVHLTACVYVLFFAFRLELSRGEWAILLLTIGAVMAAETMNTAMEELCNFVKSGQNPHIRLIKDLAAGAVLLTALFAAFVGVAIFARPALWSLLREMCTAPLSLALLLLSVVIAFLFIFVSPEKLCAVFRSKKK